MKGKGKGKGKGRKGKGKGPDGSYVLDPMATGLESKQARKNLGALYSNLQLRRFPVQVGREMRRQKRRRGRPPPAPACVRFAPNGKIDSLILPFAVPPGHCRA